jgi:hypothetical protein
MAMAEGLKGEARTEKYTFSEITDTLILPEHEPSVRSDASSDTTSEKPWVKKLNKRLNKMQENLAKRFILCFGHD